MDVSDMNNVEEKELKSVLGEIKDVLNCSNQIEQTSKAADFVDKHGVDLFVKAGALLALKYDPHVTGDLATIRNNLPEFNKDKRSVRTIGTFYYKANNGGAERVVCDLANIWTEMGYKVILFTDEEVNENDYEIDKRVERVVIPVISVYEYSSIEKRIDFLSQRLDRYSIDLFVYHAWQDYRMIADFLAIRSKGVRLFVHTHNLFCVNYKDERPSVAYFNSILHKIYRLSDGVLALSEVDNLWWRLHGLNSTNVVNPCHIEESVPGNTLKGNHLLFVGRLARDKQVLDAIKAVELAHQINSDIKFSIVGDSDDEEYKREIREYIDRNSLGGFIDLCGFRSDVASFYRDADLILCTSKFEGQSLVFIESKTYGIPMISYDISNMDMIRHPEGLIVVESGNYRSMAEEIVRLLNDRTELSRLGMEAKNSSIRYSKESILKQWDVILSDTGEVDASIDMDAISDMMSIFDEYVSDGIYIRSGNNISEQRLQYYMAQCSDLDKTIKELKGSKSYRLGYALLHPFSRKD